jgi:TonB family protein
MLHEQIHVRQRHSWDLIFVELAGIILWVNPVMVLYKRSLQVIHEYLADHRVLQYGFEKGAYLNLLLRQLTLQNEWMLGHQFNYLLTKNRFKMLKKHHYSKWAPAKFALALPFIVLLLMLNCKTKTEDNQVPENDPCANFTLPEGAVPLEWEEGMEIIVVDENGNPSDEITYVWYTGDKEEEPLRFVEEMPEPVGGMDAFYKFLQENLKYPADLKEKGISGQVYIEFVIEKDGSIDHVKVVKGAHPDLDAEAMRVVKMLPKWKPGKQNGKPVRCFYNIPIRFTIDKEK